MSITRVIVAMAMSRVRRRVPDKACAMNECRRNKSQPSAAQALFVKAGVRAESRILDVGGGIFPFIDWLLERDVKDIWIWNCHFRSLYLPKPEIPPIGSPIKWIDVDMTQLLLEKGCCTHWHDSIVLHRLFAPAHLRAYAKQAANAVSQGGYALIRCASINDGKKPEKNIRRFSSPEGVAVVLGSEFMLKEVRREKLGDGTVTTHALFAHL
ncbi:hypothetical protein [Pseudoxanthomonas sp. X-1]|uniref:hypothetical protein n=1 Tax=Pseudoxanthomonas sp. X-1 TaxID=2571115 RepID=UPI00110BCE81|nr:hypothetical protein [Pseudoxanthomonas sp. X-1]TMN19394.1 hypothetical protein FF950_11670 [Pseudoxanthomonas sp. X-1]UAY75343.1 hypothetical protein LAJ50_03535 [Pseudoxanthomonas sp. X-1]